MHTACASPCGSDRLAIAEELVNVTADQADANHYDLLASEARLASYLAIVFRQVSEAHWYALGRPMTSVAGRPTLLSWGGTMFEYLMPNLLMRSRPGTLLARTGELAVEAQIARGGELDAPWGVSQSAFAHVDANHTYQYRRGSRPTSMSRSRRATTSKFG